jgi:hypothetical protein
MSGRDATEEVDGLWRTGDRATMTAARDRSALHHSVETLADEIGRIVAERQDLRANGAPPDALEENRRRLAAAQSELSRLLIERYLVRPQVALTPQSI